MKKRDFYFFVVPSLLMMFLFIAVPLAIVFKQSFYITQNVFEKVEVETCTPGFLKQICETKIETKPKLDENGNVIEVSVFVGFENYKNLLQINKFKNAVYNLSLNEIEKINFWKAFRFTISFCLITLPLVIFLGLLIALTVNNLTRSIKGPVIFISLLPFIITPIIGALAIRWLFVGEGILTALLEYLMQKDIAMFANAWTLELLMIIYRVWHVAPFAFIVFYAGLQTVNKEILESAVIDGANRFERLRYIIIPHLMPLIIFVSLIHLMDSYRVFEEIVAFSSQAYVISLQWLTYDFLIPDETGNRLINRASTSAMLTMVGVSIIITPLLKRTWEDYREGKL
jgi:multiple sugar transport system permease protein|tara:strand:- start:1106 stop:2131 length:1026 start_codon:yes stop_codon:yes gene_type:complete